MELLKSLKTQVEAAEARAKQEQASARKAANEAKAAAEAARIAAEAERTATKAAQAALQRVQQAGMSRRHAENQGEAAIRHLKQAESGKVLVPGTPVSSPSDKETEPAKVAVHFAHRLIYGVLWPARG